MAENQNGSNNTSKFYRKEVILKQNQALKKSWVVVEEITEKTAKRMESQMASCQLNSGFERELGGEEESKVAMVFSCELQQFVLFNSMRGKKKKERGKFNDNCVRGKLSAKMVTQ